MLYTNMEEEHTNSIFLMLHYEENFKALPNSDFKMQCKLIVTRNETVGAWNMFGSWVLNCILIAGIQLNPFLARMGGLLKERRGRDHVGSFRTPFTPRNLNLKFEHAIFELFFFSVFLILLNN